MRWLYFLITVILLVLVRGNATLEDEVGQNEPQLEHIRSPMLEVFMHLPRNFRDVRAFTSSLTTQQQRPKRKAAGTDFTRDRPKREAEPSKEVKLAPTLEKPEKLMSPMGPHPPLPTPDAIRSPNYQKYPVKEFDIVDIDDPDDPRRRRNDSSDDDNSQRDKRTFLEEGSGETTTPLPFWKRKKESPPFVTGRGGPAQNGNGYAPAQHRSGESARESHSLKNLDKTVQSNEITRSNQDNYFSATNRRTYSRQYDAPASSTPKSVYDTIDYSKRNQVDLARNQDNGRSQERKAETPREARPTHEQYTNRQYPYNFPWMYDRPYYQPPYPYPTEVLGRGVEYYHRTYDPTTGRIIYYANMPEQRSYDYRYVDPISRNFYVNRPYGYDPYYRNYVPPFDYRFANGFGRSVDYLRNARSNSQAYSYPYQEREKYPRDARAFETGSRLKDDYRNKTYVIYDADEGRPQFPRSQYVPENNRPVAINPSGPPLPFRQPSFPPQMDYFPPAAFPPRNQFYPSSPIPLWGYNQRSAQGVTNTNSNSRPLNSPEVQLPLTTSTRGGLENSKKS